MTGTKAMEKLQVLFYLGAIFITTCWARINPDGCGSRKGCYRDPANCDPLTFQCEHFLTWQDMGETIDFVISGKVVRPANVAPNTWTAVGYSSDKVMPNTPVTDCIYNITNNTFLIQQSYNVASGYDNSALPNNTLGLDVYSFKGIYEQDTIECSFTSLKHVSNTSKVADLSKKFYLFLAYGPADNKNVKHKHNGLVISPVQVNFSENSNIGGEASLGSYTLVKVHGALMIIAWVFLASLGVAVARFLQSTTTQISGTAVWFQLHRGLMVSVVIVTLVGFAVILIQEGKYFASSVLHPIMGLCVIFLALVQPLLAVFRPAKDTDSRSIFNWTHRSIGFLVHVLSGLTMFFGVQMEKADMPEWTKYLLMVFIVLRVLTDGIISRVVLGDSQFEFTRLNLNYEGKSTANVSPWSSFAFVAYIMGITIITIVLISFLF